MTPAEEPGSGARRESRVRSRIMRYSIVPAGAVLLAGAVLFLYRRQPSLAPSRQRVLTRLTFDDGLQIGATWSPDGRFIAYSSDRGGKFDIWVQQVSGGDPVQITKGPGHNWQPDWSPDGNYIAYRSENGEGGLFIVPALGGEGLERRIASFGYHPRWSPDSSQILFQTYLARRHATGSMWLTLTEAPRARSWRNSSHGTSCRRIQPRGIPTGRESPSGLGILQPGLNFWTVSLAGGVAVKSEIAPEMVRQLGEVSGASESAWAIDIQFSWAPSGKAIYFERSFRGAKNLWKMTVDPNTLKAAAIERLTTGTGPDTQLAVSSRWKETGLYRRNATYPGLALSIRCQQWPHNRQGRSGDLTWNGGLAAELVARRQEAGILR